MHPKSFVGGAPPGPAGGAYSAPPDPLAGFKGPTSKEGEGWGREGKGRKGRGRRGNGGVGRGRDGRGGNGMEGEALGPAHP